MRNISFYLCVFCLVNLMGVSISLGSLCVQGLNESVCRTNGSRFVSSTLGASAFNVTGQQTMIVPQGYYQGTSLATMSDTSLIPLNIAQGISIFGVSGSFVPTFQTAMVSTQHRSQGYPQVPLSTEASAGVAYVNSPSAYRAVADVVKDRSPNTDSFIAGAVTLVNRTTWSDTTCGTTQTTIAGRIADCAANPIIGPESTWDGAVKGNSGQGQWKLVTRTGDVFATERGREVWQDQRTGLLWSSRVATVLNWCKASGSNFITNNPAAQDDPSNLCDNSASQNTGVGPAVKAISACFEDGDNYFTSTDVDIDSAGKAGLNLSSSPSVAWRLPTSYDYILADINGLRYIIPDEGSEDEEWTATLIASSREYASGFSITTGLRAPQLRNSSTHAVRCVGR